MEEISGKIDVEVVGDLDTKRKAQCRIYFRRICCFLSVLALVSLQHGQLLFAFDGCLFLSSTSKLAQQRCGTNQSIIMEAMPMLEPASRQLPQEAIIIFPQE